MDQNAMFSRQVKGPKYIPLKRSHALNGHSAARASAEALEKRREHDQLTFIASEAMKVREAFEKDNACAQEGFVNPLVGIIDRAR